nr:ubiquitin carboxyl-terminal hydrolase 2-like isoform X1 [Tanacetum cinerariifolium]
MADTLISGSGDGPKKLPIPGAKNILITSALPYLDHGDGLLHDQLDDFTFSLLDSLFSKGQRTVKSIPPKCRLGFSRVLKGELDKVICKLDDISCWEESIINAIRSWSVPGGSL